MEFKPETYTNLNYLNEIAEGDTGFVMEMISDYLSKVPAQLQELKVAFRDGNQSQTGFIAHKLKSSFQFMGTQQLVDYASRIERHTNGKSEENLDYILEDMSRIISHVLVELKQKMEELKA